MSNKKRIALLLLFLGFNQLLEWTVVSYLFSMATKERYFNFLPLWLAWTCGLGILFALWWQANKKPPLGWWWLLAGFLSNVLTYMVRGSFIDFLPTGVSYFNLSDLVILGGMLQLIFWYRRPV